MEQGLNLARRLGRPNLIAQGVLLQGELLKEAGRIEEAITYLPALAAEIAIRSQFFHGNILNGTGGFDQTSVPNPRAL